MFTNNNKAAFKKTPQTILLAQKNLVLQEI